MSKLPKLDIQLAISAIQIKMRKIFFWKNRYHDVVSLVPNFQHSARSSSFFWAFFLHIYGTVFFGHPITTDANKNKQEKKLSTDGETHKKTSNGENHDILECIAHSNREALLLHPGISKPPSLFPMLSLLTYTPQWKFHFGEI